MSFVCLLSKLIISIFHLRNSIKRCTWQIHILKTRNRDNSDFSLEKRNMESDTGTSMPTSPTDLLVFNAFFVATQKQAVEFIPQNSSCQELGQFASRGRGYLQRRHLNASSYLIYQTNTFLHTLQIKPL